MDYNSTFAFHLLIMEGHWRVYKAEEDIVARFIDFKMPLMPLALIYFAYVICEI